MAVHSDRDPVGTDPNRPVSTISNKIEEPNTPDSDDQLTICTILSLSPELGNTKEDNFKVESLHAGNSLESIKSVTTINDSESASVEHEKWYTTTIQVFIPFMIAGAGTIGAGIVLGSVEDYEVFIEIQALYILVPALIGLKGNLDTCLASRLSTQAHLGNMAIRRELFKMIIGNIMLVQIQAIVAACSVAIFAVVVSALVNGNFHWDHAILLATSAVLTATMSCFVLDVVLIFVIILAWKYNLNPDNVAIPFAGSIGDVISLLILSTWAKLLYSIHDSYPMLMIGILAGYVFILLPIWIFIVRKNKYTKKILTHGWTPVLSALIISGLGGLVLNEAVEQFFGFVVFQPIINGIGGNLVSIQSSRIATMFHKTSLPGVIPPHTKQWVWPWKALFTGVLPAKSARILVLITIPGQTVFLFVADLIYNDGVSRVTPVFALTYLTVCMCQVMLLLYICHLMTHTMWSFKIDPDNSAIPYLTAIGDLLGSCFLLVAFMFMRSIHHEYSPLKADSTKT